MKMVALIRPIFSPRMLSIYDQCVVSGCNFLTMVIMARQLKAEDFGLFSIAMLSMLFLANFHRAIFTQPMNIIGVNEKKQQLKARMLALLKAHLYTLPIPFAVLAVASFFLFPQLALFFSVAIYVVCYFLQEMLRRYFYTLVQPGDALLNDSISYIGQVFLLMLMASVWGADAAIAFYIMAFTSLLAFLLGLVKLDLLRDVERQSVLLVMQQQWGISKWLVLTTLAVWGSSQVYPFMVASLGSIVVASLSACRNLLNVLSVFTQSVGNYLPTRVVEVLRHEGKAGLRRHLVKTLTQAVIISVVFIGVVYISAGPLLHFVYRGNYDAVEPLLFIFASGSACGFIGVILGSYSMAMEDSRSNFLANLGSSAVTFTIGLWLIKTQGFSGAAIATFLSLATAMLLQGLFVLVRYHRLPAESFSHA